MHKEYNGRWSKCQEVSTLVDVSYLQTGTTLTMFHNGIMVTDESKGRDYDIPRSWSRSEITTFSNKSRSRLFKLLSNLRYNRLSEGLFVTLTYHYGHKKNHSELKKDLQAWLQYLRDNVKDVYYIWRLEFQKRGAIHYHVMVFTPRGNSALQSEKIQTGLSQAWHRIADPESDAHGQYGTQVKLIDNYKMAICYLSKYVAKVDQENEQEYTGRRWGASRNIPVSAYADITVSWKLHNILREIIQLILTPVLGRQHKFVVNLTEFKSVYAYISPGRFLDALLEFKPPPSILQEYNRFTNIFRDFYEEIAFNF